MCPMHVVCGKPRGSKTHGRGILGLLTGGAACIRLMMKELCS